MASYLVQLESARERLRQGTAQDLFDSLEQSHTEVLAELDKYEQSDPPAALRLSTLLWRFWMDRGLLAEGRRRLGAALTLSPTGPAAARAEALFGAGTLAFRQGDNAAAAAQFSDCLVLARAARATDLEAAALGGLARCALRDRDIPTAATLAAESLAIARAAVDELGLASALHVVAYTAYIDQDDDRARTLFEESIDLERRLGNLRAAASDMTNLGSVETRAGRLDRAAELCAQALHLARQTNSMYLMPYCVANIGSLTVAGGEARRGARLLAGAEVLFERSGAAIDPGTAVEFERYRTRARQSLGEAEFDAVWREGRALAPGDAEAEAQNLVGR
ncbi:MAG: hypothetical protein NVSMB2_24140 [Chloroflexota bacterium]